MYFSTSRDVGALPEVLDLLSVFRREEVKEFSIEDIQERRNIGIFLPLEGDAADVPVGNEPVVLFLLHAGDPDDLHVLTSSA